MSRSKQYLFPRFRHYLDPESVEWIRKTYGGRSVSQTIQRAINELREREKTTQDGCKT